MDAPMENPVDGVGLTDSQVEEGLKIFGGLSSQDSFNSIWSMEDGFTKIVDQYTTTDYQEIEDGDQRVEILANDYIIHSNNADINLNQLGITWGNNEHSQALPNESQAMSSSMRMHNYSNFDHLSQSVHGENLAMPDTTLGCNIPSNTNWPGEFDFSLSFHEQPEKMTKSTSWTYSELLDKLFINMGVSCIVCFRVKNPPPGCIIRALPIFEKSDHVKDVVKRCPTHCLPTDPSNHDHGAPEHLVRCESDFAEYRKNPSTGRLSVEVPFVPPQVGTDSSQYLYKFMCLGSCVGGLNRRPLQLIYTLEKDGKVLGRRALKVRICACPGRDRKGEENPPCSAAGVPNKKTKNLAQTTSADILVIEPASKKQKFDEELFTLTVQGRANYEVLLKVKEALELSSLVPKETMQAYRADQQQIIPSQVTAAKPPDLHSVHNTASTSKNPEKVECSSTTQATFSASSRTGLKRTHSISREKSGETSGCQITSMQSSQSKIKREPDELVASWLSSINMGCYVDVFAKRGYKYMRQLEDLIEDDIYHLQIGKAHRVHIWKNLLEYKGLPSISPQSQESLPPPQSSQASTGQDTIIHISHVRFRRVASIKKHEPL